VTDQKPGSPHPKGTSRDTSGRYTYTVQSAGYRRFGDAAERLRTSELAHSWSEFDGIQLPVVFYTLQGVQAAVNEADS